MPRSSSTRRFVFPALMLLLVAMWPLASLAQHRTPRRVLVVGGIGFPYYAHQYYSPWWWGPYPYGPYGYPLVNYRVSSLRVQAQPENAQVFVDGYFAGEVDEFNGIFQRLELTPGGHEITIYHEQFRTFRQRLYLRPGADQRLRVVMEPLAAGEVAELPAAPVEPEPAAEVRRAEPTPPEPEPQVREEPVRTGTLAVRIDPPDAEVLIDGEPQVRPAASDLLRLDLPEGRHKVEVRKAGFATYAQDILIRRGATLRLTVTLDRQP